MLRGLRLTDYLQIVDAAARLMRDAKARLPQQATSILARLKLEADRFARMLAQLKEGALRGSVLGHLRRSGQAAALAATTPA